MSATAVVKDLTKLPIDVVKEVKAQATPATKSGVLNQAVGFAIGVPISMLYDYLYSLMSQKLITNDIARDIIKVAMPLGIGIVVQVAKVPFGNIIAGTGYAIALISAGRIIYNRVKGLLGKSTQVGDVPKTSDMTDIEAELTVWGVQ